MFEMGNACPCAKLRALIPKQKVQAWRSRSCMTPPTSSRLGSGLLQARQPNRRGWLLPVRKLYISPSLRTALPGDVVLPCFTSSPGLAQCPSNFSLSKSPRSPLT